MVRAKCIKNAFNYDTCNAFNKHVQFLWRIDHEQNGRLVSYLKYVLDLHKLIEEKKVKLQQPHTCNDFSLHLTFKV